MEIPKKISPCPILEAIVEIRFDTTVPSEAIFGVVYNEFKKEYPKVEKLPILQIPEHIRMSDPNLIHKPCYKLSNDNMILQVGPKVIAIVNTSEYIGWESFSGILINVFRRLFSIIEIKAMHRAAVRYVNLFEAKDIYDHSNLKITLNGDKFWNNEINMTASIEAGGCTHRLMIINKAGVIVNNEKKSGSLVDIDTVLNSCSIDTGKDIDQFNECIHMAHEEEKKLFFSLLERDFLGSLNPEY